VAFENVWPALATPQANFFWLLASFAASAAITLFFTQKKRSLPIFFLLLVVLVVLFGIAAVPAFAVTLFYRYSRAKALALEPGRKV
jgi:hypothetical protein